MTMLIAMVTTMATMTMKAMMAMMMMGMTMKTTGLGFVTGCCLATDADSE